MAMTLLPRFLIMTLAIAASALHADEGMWLYTDLPRKDLAERHGFTADDAWVEHLRCSSVRFGGGSGSFVSADGLIITNHHVGAASLHKLGDERHDYYRDGFLAQTRAEELKCPDLELEVLMGIEDVTARINAAVLPGQSPEQAFAARRGAKAAIEKESLERTGLRSEVVVLYQGGLYHLYRYQRYTDVRLVFAPEHQIAFFGGDPDNFEYPRFDLDICFFRAYEHDQPAAVQHHLAFCQAGAGQGELVFVSGHPGRTSRNLTMDELADLRDRQLPYTLSYLYQLEVLLVSYSQRSEEQARRAKRMLFGVQNGRKALDGRLAGLLDPALWGRKLADEQRLRQAVAGRPELAEVQPAWDAIAAAQRIIAEHGALNYQLESAHGFNSTLFRMARTVLRSVDERSKPSGERLREYRDSNRTQLELELFSPEPLYDDFEILKLTQSLTWLAGRLGAAHPLVQRVLAGMSPHDRALDAVRRTRIKEVALRRTLYAGTPQEVRAAEDPLIEMARLVDAQARTARQLIEVQEEVKQQAYARIARARLALGGTGLYPDATGTLRLSYGTVKGYEQDGRQIPCQTTFAGLYDCSAAHGDRFPFALPRRWQERKARLDPQTPFDFIATTDIIGGNSGSPVVNRKGEFVGIIFDGNLPALAWEFSYGGEQGRALAVHGRAIIAALREVYDAGTLADELLR